MRSKIPIFPLGTVLFPGGRLPLRIFEPRYVGMTERCLEDDAVFGVCLILDGREVGAPAAPHAIGCTARIVDSAMPRPGEFTLLAIGETRFRIAQREVQSDGLMMAMVDELPDVAPAPIPPAMAPLVQLLRRAIGQVGDQSFVPPLRLDDAGWVAQRLAERLPLPTALRQRVLECADGLEQLTLVAAALADQGGGP